MKDTYEKIENGIPAETGQEMSNKISFEISPERYEYFEDDISAQKTLTIKGTAKEAARWVLGTVLELIMTKRIREGR